MSNKNNKITYVNEEALKKQGKSKSFKELLAYYKGSITTALTFLATNKAIVFFGNIGEDKIIRFLAQEELKHPELAKYILNVEKFVSVNWAAIQANPVLCGAILSGFVALGATAVWGVKKLSLNHKQKKGYIRSTEKNNSIEESSIHSRNV